jgi:hypothetical protein
MSEKSLNFRNNDFSLDFILCPTFIKNVLSYLRIEGYERACNGENTLKLQALWNFLLIP